MYISGINGFVISLLSGEVIFITRALYDIHRLNGVIVFETCVLKFAEDVKKIEKDPTKIPDILK